MFGAILLNKVRTKQVRAATSSEQIPSNEVSTEMASKHDENGSLEAAERVGSEQLVRAVDIALGVPVAAAQAVGEAVEPWTNADTRAKELDEVRERVERVLKVAEERGSELRARFTEQAKDTTGDQFQVAREQLRKAQERVREIV